MRHVAALLLLAAARKVVPKDNAIGEHISDSVTDLFLAIHWLSKEADKEDK